MKRRPPALDRRWFGSYLLPVATTLLAFTLQLYALDGKSLWFDEMGTLANSGWGDSWQEAILSPLHTPLIPKPPLSLLITRLFLFLDESVFLLRLPSVLFATLTVPLTYAVGKSLFDRRVGLLAASLLVIAPLQIRYAQEARMYAQFSFLSMLSLYLFWRAIRSTEGRWWLGFAAVTVLNFYTFPFAILVLGVLALFAFWLLLRARARPRYPFRAWHLFAALLAVALLVVPMIPFYLRGLMSEEGLGGGAARDWDLAALLSAVRLSSGASTAGAVVYGALFLLASAVLFAKNRDLLALALGWLVLPILTVLVIPFGHEALIRYFVFTLPLYLLVVAYGLQVAMEWLASRAGRRGAAPGLVAAILLAILIGISAPSLAAYYREDRQNWRDATWLVYSQFQPDDTILVPREFQQAGVLFYTNQWAGEANPLAKGNVQIIPQDLSGFRLPRDRVGNTWLIVPDKGRFLPGGEVDAALQPYLRLGEPIVFAAAHPPQDLQLIAPVSYGNVAVLRVEEGQLPTVYFWADEERIDSGDCTRLTWEVDKVQEVYLDGEGVVGHDQREVCPAATTSYELHVIYLDGTEGKRRVEVVVDPP